MLILDFSFNCEKFVSIVRCIQFGSNKINGLSPIICFNNRVFAWEPDAIFFKIILHIEFNLRSSPKIFGIFFEHIEIRE
jgi:hypothetical protein